MSLKVVKVNTKIPSGTPLLERIRSLTGGDGLRAQLVRGGVGSLVLRVFGLALSLMLTIILARSLGPEGFGTYAYAFALVSLLAIPVQAGIPSLLLREVARNQVTEHWGLIRGLLTRFNQAVIVFAFTIASIGGSVIWAFEDRFTPTQIETFAWALVLLPLMALGRLRGAALQGLRYVLQGQLPDLVLRPIIFVSLLVAALIIAGAGALDSASAMGLHVLAALLAFVVGAILLWRALPHSVKTAAPEYDYRRWFTSVLPLSFIAGMQAITGQTDIVMLGIFATAEDVGLYRIALQGAMLVLFAHTAVTQVVAPHVARAYVVGELTKVQRMVTMSARAIFFGALPVAVILVFFGYPILRMVFGAEYGAAYSALAILCCGMLLVSLAGSIDSLLKMTGHERVIARSVTLAAGANIFLNAVLIPRFGIEGAATATILASTLWKAYLVLQVRKQLGVISLPFYPRQWQSEIIGNVGNENDRR